MNPPSITATAFSCPHCNAYTTQYWYNLRANGIADGKPPHRPTVERFEEKVNSSSNITDENKKIIFEWVRGLHSGFTFINHEGESKWGYDVNNLYLSSCYHCSKIAVWLGEKIIFPEFKDGNSPNSDMPEEIRRDFEEARSIVNSSPRGAAALLRLCVQKLCKELGEKGKNIDQDIASLVKKGLNPLIQKSLDIVRVIGNESVHPGAIDMKDDRETALRLFGLINSIIDQMISHPKKVEELYALIPQDKRDSIDKRDGNASI
jgi:hypothetical protein